MINSNLLDLNGFLIDAKLWNEDIAKAFAQHENLTLTPDHWLVLHFTHEFFAKNALFPTQRHIVKMLKEKLGEAKGTSIYLQQLFPNGPRQIALIAGFPKPVRCV